MRNEEERRKLIEQMSKPLPKLGFVEVTAFDIDVAQDNIPVDDNIQWNKYPGKKMNSPITCRFFNLTEYYKDSDKTWDDLTVIASGIIAELRENGVNATTYYHEIQGAENPRDGAQLCIAVPNTIPVMYEGNPEIRRDIPSAGKFIAYLLDKNYATPEEIEKVFNSSFLDESKQHRGGFER